MKKTSLFLIALSFSLASCAQNAAPRNVPAVVANAFRQQFPKADDIEWEKKGSLYEVEFETGLTGRDNKMLIDSSGRITYHESEIAVSELPDAVKRTITEQFAGYATDDVKKIKSDGLVTYQAELKKSPEKWEVTFSHDGKVLGKVSD